MMIQIPFNGLFYHLFKRDVWSPANGPFYFARIDGISSVIWNQVITDQHSYIKIFKYARGARILGIGTIKVQVKTNTGWQFNYRQKSSNGEFIVPYPTTGGSYE